MYDNSGDQGKLLFILEKRNTIYILITILGGRMTCKINFTILFLFMINKIVLSNMETPLPQC